MTTALKEQLTDKVAHAVDPARIRVGPDVLELVSTAMYVDPRTLFREYLQNAADAIDVAREGGLLGPTEGTVNIAIDRGARTLRIRDDGTGLGPERFYETLTALGGSTKRGTAARGFRGVGRLAGLGYARELVFRSRVDDGPVSELTWDCRRLRALLRDATEAEDLPTLISGSTRGTTGEADENTPERFFEVELRGIARLRNDVLLNHDLVRAYISEHCPVPFADTFTHRGRIGAHLKTHVATTDLTVILDDSPAAVTRPHRDRMVLEDGRMLDLKEVKTFELHDRNGAVGAVGWIAHHAYDGAVPGPMLVRGVRLRHGNVQVGGHAPLEDLFKEERFNSWIVGELHVVDRHVVPNARRDHFEQNAAWTHLANRFLPLARELSDRCRHTSIRRNGHKRFETAMRMADEALVRIESGTLGPTESEKIKVQAAEAVAECGRLACSRFFTEDQRIEAEEAVKILRARLEKDHPTARPARVLPELAHLPKRDRAVYERVLDVVLESATTLEEGRRIVDAVLARVSQEAHSP